MWANDEAIEADINPEDRGESPPDGAPAHPGGFTPPGALNDLAFDLTQKSAGFRRSMPPKVEGSCQTKADRR